MHSSLPSIIVANLLGNRSLFQGVQNFMVHCMWILILRLIWIHFVHFCVLRFVACNHNYMIESSEKCNYCEGGFWTSEFGCNNGSKLNQRFFTSSYWQWTDKEDNANALTHRLVMQSSELIITTSNIIPV